MEEEQKFVMKQKRMALVMITWTVANIILYLADVVTNYIFFFIVDVYNEDDDLVNKRPKEVIALFEGIKAA